MAHIIINGEHAPVCVKALAKNEVKFTEFNEKCEDCGLALDESSCIEGNTLKCGGCGKKYEIHNTVPGTAGQEKHVSKPETKTEKIAKQPKAEKPAKASKVEKVAKPAPKAEKVAKPAKASKAESTDKPAKVKARAGSITSTELVATDKANAREGSCAEMILKHFKKPTAPAKIVDKLVSQWKDSHAPSDTFKKNPRGYMMWTVLDLLRKGGLKKA